MPNEKDMNWYKTAQTQFPKITVVSLDMLIFHLIKDDIKNKNIISIRDPKPGISDKKYKYIDRLGLPNLLVATFDDLWREEHRSHGILPENSDVSRIMSWAKTKWEQNHEDFFVHCTAGISRSSSIAAVLNTMFQNKEFAISEINPKYHSPNPRILDMGEKMLNAPGLKDEVEKLVHDYDKKRLEEE